jgi:disulfide bond formation protein DsbB
MILNAIALYGIALVLTVAFAAQLLLHELPCPLCLLQRILFALLRSSTSASDRVRAITPSRC